MKRKILVLLVFHFCCLMISSAQDAVPIPPEHLIGIYSGYYSHTIRDDVASPLLYSGAGSPVLLEYNYNRSKTRHAFTFFIGKTKLRSSNTDKIAGNSNFIDNWNALLGYAYSRNANVLQRFNLKCYWGFTFLSVLNYRSLYFTTSFGSYNKPFFEQLNSLGAHFSIEKNIGPKKNDLAGFKIHLPFVAYATLNDRYNAVVGESTDRIDSDKGIFGQVLGNGSLVTFNKLIEFQTELSYARFLTKRIGIKLEHRLHFYSTAHYRNLLYSRYLSNQYLVGLFVKL